MSSSGLLVMKASRMWISLYLISWERCWVLYLSTVVRPVGLLYFCILSHASCSADQSEIFLREEMVLYHQSRIEHSYTPNLRASFKAYNVVRTRNYSNTPENSSVSDTTLSVLRTLHFDRELTVKYP